MLFLISGGFDQFLAREPGLRTKGKKSVPVLLLCSLKPPSVAMTDLNGTKTDSVHSQTHILGFYLTALKLKKTAKY